MFEKCLIVVSSEEEKQELLRGCKHIHDFTVWFQGKIEEVTDEFGVARDIGVTRTMDEEDCGVSLNFDEYPFVNFLAGLHDCEDKSVREEYIKIVPINKVDFVTEIKKIVGKHYDVEGWNIDGALEDFRDPWDEVKENIIKIHHFIKDNLEEALESSNDYVKMFAWMLKNKPGDFFAGRELLEKYFPESSQTE